MAEHYTDEDARQAEVVIGLGEGIDRDCKLCIASGRRGACPAHAARAVLDAVAPAIAARANQSWAELTSLAPRLWSRVEVGKAAECWPWTGPTVGIGHGRYDNPAGQVAHRFAWALASGRLPEAHEVVRHACDNPPCCNPAHLVIGTQAENVADMLDRGRGLHARDHCRSGHELSGENLLIRGSKRRCKTCARQDEAKRYAAKGRASCPFCGKEMAFDNTRRHLIDMHAKTSAEATALLRADEIEGR